MRVPVCEKSFEFSLNVLTEIVEISDKNIISKKIISLHIRSMWETICDALASWSGWEFGSKIPVYPILGFGSQNTPPPKIEI